MRFATTLKFTRPAAVCLLVGGCAMFPPPKPPHTAPGPEAPAETSVAAPSLEMSGIERGDTLAKLRRGFHLPALGGNEVERQENWYRRHPRALDHLAEPGSWYLPYITGEVLRRGLPAEIALLPAIESHFDAHARSHSGAAGLWQFTEVTAEHFGLHRGQWLDQRMHLELSTSAALDYLEELNRRFRGDWLLTLAAYNAGEGTVRKLIEQNRRRGLPTDFRRLRFRAETRQFVPKLVALRNVVADPTRFGVTLPRVTDRIRFVRMDAGRQIRHREVSALCRVPNRLIAQINAEQIRGSTPPNGPHSVRLPSDCGARFDAARTAAVQAPTAPSRTAATYVVRPGDSLWAIAEAHGVSVAALKTSNPGVDSRLSPGQRISIPDEHRSDVSSSSRIVHEVTQGDTLWHIATRYRVSTNDIARWNRIAPDSALQPGQRLNIRPR